MIRAWSMPWASTAASNSAFSERSPIAPGLGNLLGDPGHVLVLHLVELGLELLVALLRHRDSVVGHAESAPYVARRSGVSLTPNTWSGLWPDVTQT